MNSFISTYALNASFFYENFNVICIRQRLARSKIPMKITLNSYSTNMARKRHSSYGTDKKVKIIESCFFIV